jgi:UDP-N-acetylmuramoylalanine--D-glutamate ligase
MVDLSHLRSLDKPIAIFGLGISGQAVANACLQSGVKFHAWDDSFSKRDDVAHYPLIDFTSDMHDYAFLVPAAGIKPSHPILTLARKQNIPLFSDVDLLLQAAPHARVVGITGTNGKSTTTALIAHILEKCGIKNAVGGNIGRAACTLPNLSADGVYVLELSSYQLAITQAPIADIAVYLNLTSDHLEWHGTMNNYALAKENILKPRLNRKQVAIIGIDTRHTKSVALRYQPMSSHSLVTISTQTQADLFVKDGYMYAGAELIVDLNQHQFLHGKHNHENCIAAFAACRALGIEKNAIIQALMSFEGLSYRQKRSAVWKNITFINDSKATNAEATAKALASFENIYWILGGQAKQDGLKGLAHFYPRVKKAYLIGEASHKFSEVLEDHLAFSLCDMLDIAVKQAFLDAKKQSEKAVILLSPACASFDQYQNFEKRGDHFEQLVKDLIESQTE